jgi:hypothetical protein
MSANTARLPMDGRLLGPRFVQWKYLAYTDKEGKNCFQVHDHQQVVDSAVNHCPVQRNIEYASLIQKGTWD